MYSYIHASQLFHSLEVLKKLVLLLSHFLSLALLNNISQFQYGLKAVAYFCLMCSCVQALISNIFFLYIQITSKFAVLFITVQYNVTISANGKLRIKWIV